MKKQDVIYLFFLLFVLFSCSESSEIKQKEGINADSAIIKEISAATNLESKVIEVIMDLPEVRKASDHIDSLTHHQRGISVIYDGWVEGSDDVAVRVGYNGEERFEVYYFFYVNPKTMAVKIDDIINATILPIEEWRKLKAAEQD